MILRRVIEHVKDQNWFAVGIDFVIVVVGVFIGIQVANWNEAQAERRRLDVQLASLNAEFTENLNRFDAYQARLQEQIEDISTLRRIIADKPFDVKEGELDRMLMNVFGVPVFSVDRTTLDELKDGGKLIQLRDMGLRQPLVAWEETYVALRRLEGDTIALRNLVFAPFVVEQLSLGAMAEHYGSAQDLISPSPFDNHPAMLVGNRELDNILTLQLGPAVRRLDFLTLLRQETEAVLARLE
ncbi:MAG: DUF6090 family protein, partial [Desulfuromonadales bacterium]|nr:DUF6090 family protein [Desulfuromonadales bacterium]